MPSSPSIKITKSEFAQIENKSEDLPLVAYCGHYGVHTMVGLATDFYSRLMPRLGPELLVKLQGVDFSIPCKEVVIHKSPRGQCSIKMKAAPRKWHPLSPPPGIKPLMIAVDGWLGRDNIALRMLGDAQKLFQGPICVFGDNRDRQYHGWKGGIDDRTGLLSEQKEKLDFLLASNEGRDWLSQAVELAKDAGAVFIGGDSYDGKADEDDLLVGLRDHFQFHTPVYLLPSYEYDDGCEKRWQSFWDQAMLDLDRRSLR
jgi:hypothetical protein